MSEIEFPVWAEDWEGSNTDYQVTIAEIDSELVECRTLIDFALEQLIKATSAWQEAKRAYDFAFRDNYELLKDRARNQTEAKTMANNECLAEKLAAEQAELEWETAKKILDGRQSELSAVQTRAKLYIAQKDLDTR